MLQGVDKGANNEFELAGKGETVANNGAIYKSKVADIASGIDVHRNPATKPCGTSAPVKRARRTGPERSRPIR
jgi:hypothetical protein